MAHFVTRLLTIFIYWKLAVKLNIFRYMYVERIENLFALIAIQIWLFTRLKQTASLKWCITLERSKKQNYDSLLLSLFSTARAFCAHQFVVISLIPSLSFWLGIVCHFLFEWAWLVYYGNANPVERKSVRVRANGNMHAACICIWLRSCVKVR